MSRKNPRKKERLLIKKLRNKRIIQAKEKLARKIRFSGEREQKRLINWEIKLK